MAKKISGWKTKGMNRDLSVSAFNPEFAFENMNLRLATNDSNTTLSWVNEKGTAQIDLKENGAATTIYGACIGTAVLGKYLILFTTSNTKESDPDHIYRLKYADDKNSFNVVELFHGDLDFDAEHPLETLVSYESENIQKVYWTDGKRQPRLINIAPDNDSNTGNYTNTSFDFVPTLTLKEEIKVKKILGGGGMFAPGVIQYAFTYYNKYGQESNIFYTTPLYYISYADRGASPEDKVDNTFRITVSNVDKNFDYLRIYSIQRTSINGTPICKRVQDIEVKKLKDVDGQPIDTTSYIDTGYNGDAIDPTELLYKGGSSILVGTMEQKDGTLFMGDITTPQNEQPNIKPSDVEIKNDTRIFYPKIVSSDNYEYANQLSSYKDKAETESVPCVGFKAGNTYRCGVQFQDKTGKWSDPIFIEDADVTKKPETTTTMKPDEEGSSDVSIFIEITNHNGETLKKAEEYIPAKIRNEAYLTIKDEDDRNKKVRVLLEGQSVITIGAGITRKFTGKAINGANYIGNSVVDIILTDVDYDTNAVKLTFDQLPNFGEGEEYRCTIISAPEPSPGPEPEPGDDDAKLFAVYTACKLYPQGDEIAFDHRAVAGSGTITFNLTNNSSKRVPWNGRFCFFVSENGNPVQCYGHYKEPNDIGNMTEHWYYVNSTNYIIEIGETVAIRVPIKRYVFDNPSVLQDLTGKSLYINSSNYFRIYFSNTEVGDNYTHNGTHYVDQTGITNPSIVDGAVFNVSITEALMQNDPYYLPVGESYDTPKLYISHSNYLIPMRLSDWSRQNSGEGSNTEGSGDESLRRGGIRASIEAVKGIQDITVEIPVLKGYIDGNAISVLAEKYVKVRPVVVYPEMQDRKVVCQGVACPTMYTDNHRGDGFEPTKDLYAQSSWFFRPYYNEDPSYYEDANYPSYKSNTEIKYVEREGTGANPSKIKKAEVQGYYQPSNRFKTSWSTLTFHSPDIEFDDSMLNLDYTSSSLSSWVVGHADFLRTLSDIDIQTSTPAISQRGSGFVKKSFVKDSARGIISGLFWDDYIVEDVVDDDHQKFEWFGTNDKEKASFKWMVYLWNKSGALNNDMDRPADCGVMSAELKKKIVSNLRFTSAKIDSSPWNDVQKLWNNSKLHLFSSDQNEILKLNTGDATLSNVYRGNVDTLLIPDLTDGMYFTLPVEVLLGEDYDNTSFTDKVLGRLWGTEAGSDNGIYHWTGSSWERSDTPFCKDTGDTYLDLVAKKGSVRMKYKSTPHLVLVGEEDMTTISNSLPVVEVQRTIDPNTIFGGTSEDAKKQNIWIPCGEPVRLDDQSKRDEYGRLIIEYSWGDTYYQRWDCLKTYAFTPEDINQVVEIGSFMLETYVNIDGRYDRNRGQLSNLYMSPQNFNLINPVYSQLNNFFTYRIQDDDAYNEKKFPNQITWSKTKTSGADVDLWTNVTLASVLEMDGDKGSVRKLIRLNDQLLCFQDKGISQVLYNENVQINSTDGVPIEIANSGKVQGKRYLSDSVGCSNKWSMAQTPSGIYFMDSINKAIFMFNGQLNNLSGSLGFNTWSKKNIPSAEATWTPTEFQDFVSYYDKLNQDVLFINKNIALAFSEKLNAFTSFYNYGETPYFCNLQDTGIWIRNPYKEIVNGEEITHPAALWKHNAGEYCNFFGTPHPYSMTLVGNPEPQMDKIFTNLEFRACVDEEGTVSENKFTPFLPFDSLETWNEYQHGITTLSNRNGHSAFTHHTSDSDSSLKRKFRIWRCDIPRSNAALALDAGLNCYRADVRPQDRMRNPWLYLKLQKKAEGTMPRAEIHDILMTYFD